MKVLQYRTNINCSSCIRAVTGFIEDVPGLESWEVDTDHPDKILTVRGDQVDPGSLEEAVEDAGFSLEPMPADPA